MMVPCKDKCLRSGEEMKRFQDIGYLTPENGGGVDRVQPAGTVVRCGCHHESFSFGSICKDRLYNSSSARTTGLSNLI